MEHASRGDGQPVVALQIPTDSQLAEAKLTADVQDLLFHLFRNPKSWVLGTGLRIDECLHASSSQLFPPSIERVSGDPRAFGTYGLRFPIASPLLRPWFFYEYRARLFDSYSFLTSLQIIGRLSGKVASFTTQLESLWPDADPRLRKRIVRTLIREVIVDIDESAAEVVLFIH